MWKCVQILFLCTALLSSTVAMAADVSLLKGMYFYNFIRFTTWPKPIDAAKQVKVVVFDARLFSVILQKISEKSHFLPKMLVTPCRTPDCANNMQAVFFHDITDIKRQYTLESLAGTPVLTISDQIGFLKMGGMVELQESSGRLGFSINLAAFNKSGLYISADILEMAQDVIREANTP
ncbi:MAG: YfiR family protein [Mariprofundaceae bacterium]|nr:YfiR family protein [Mariprofundaceae bacterium]